MSKEHKPAATEHRHGRTELTGEAAHDTGKTAKRIFAYLAPYRRSLIFVGFLAITGTLLALAGPILLGRAIDTYIALQDVVGLTIIAAVMLAVYIFRGLIQMVQGYLMVSVGQKFVAGLREKLFGHIQSLSMAYYDHHKPGDLMSRISNDTDVISQTLSNGLIEFTTNILTLGGIMITMFLLNWQLAIGTVTVIPIMVWVTVLVTKRSRKAFRSVQRNLGSMNAVMEENISGIRVVKAFAQEAATYGKFEAENRTYRKAGTTADIITAALGPMFTTMATLTIAATALVGGWLALRGIISIGVIATFIIYIRTFFRPMRTIAMLYNQLQSAAAGAERIFAVLDAESEVQDAAAAVALPPVRGAVCFENVHFAYESEKPVLIDINLEVDSGQTVALVGPTGAGKTTVANLLSRFYDISSGRISIDGHDIRTVRQDSIRKQLGIVLQDTFLFSTTVMENIRYGRLDATDAEVIEAAELANADGFVRHLPEGYQSRVSEQGNNFSQGQCQLISIARAILADPRILILDEATSSVDTRTEAHIQEALLHLLEGRTAFVIAHRLSTIRNADTVLVINDHRIIERGTHDELMDLGGFYHNLYMTQFRRA
ncbi:MAG: ABC transporter ATP-binding protein [Spirochaetales bacterium]|nr:ABC transporter ATP-binding protein [Spirochaetales bacterium]